MAAKRKRKARPINTTAMDAALAFEAGKNDYRLFKPRPPKPTDEAADEPESFRFYGWMIARANEVHKIILNVRELGLSEKKSDAIVKKRADALDRAHSSDGRDYGPIW